MMKHITANRILWIVYLALLAVLLPHTAWAFGMFEPLSSKIVSYPAAFAFEAAIAALTHKLAKHIETTPKKKSRLAKFSYRYLNEYSLGLVIAIAISSLANVAHAVQFGQAMKIFGEWGLSFDVYAVAFGAILPMVSLVFARVLSNVVETEGEDDPELVELRSQVKGLRSELHQTERERDQAIQRFQAVGDVLVQLIQGEKRDKILAASELWPQLPGSSIAIIANSSPSYVSEVLQERS